MMALLMTVATALPVPGRSLAASQHGVAASSQPLAAQAAAQVLQRGGSAVDAAIAANAAQGLMEPTSNGIGGDLFTLVYVAKEDKLYGLNGSGWSPLGMTLEFLKSKGVEGELPYRGFYTGPTAQAIVDVVRERGGVMTLADLAEFKAEWVDPIQTTYRGWKVTELPPNGQGIAALEMLNILEQFPIREWGFHSPRTLHAMIEAKKLAYADLLRYIGDPRFSRVPVQQLLSKENAAARARLIDPKKAACHVEPSQLPGVTASSGSDTIYLTVVDGEGNIVSLIQSNYAGFGSGLVPKGGGFMLQNRGSLFTLQPGQPNTIAGRKRPLHTIIPAFMQKDGARIGFGIMGGWNQAQAHAQFVANIADFGMTIQQALEAGRVTKAAVDGCGGEVEGSVPQQARDELN